MTLSPFLRTQPFERLQVSDGLLINAERWQQAHTYHRERQNVLYQALHQPGIVWGLGVCPIPAPQDIPAQFRDQRWVQIQPGMAIDRMGNPIIVPEPIEFRITSIPDAGRPITVYLVIRYVDPDQLQQVTQREFVRETFRLDEKGTPPDRLDVELCRIVLQYPVTQISAPIEVFSPAPNTLDLRDRVPVGARPLLDIRLAYLTNPGDTSAAPTVQALQRLLQSAPALYPALSGTLESVALADLNHHPQAYDLLYLTARQLAGLLDPSLDILSRYVNQGGSLLVGVPTQGTAVADLWPLQGQLQEALDRLQAVLPQGGARGELTTLQQDLIGDLTGVRSDLEREMDTLTRSVHHFAQRLGIMLESFDRLPPSHPLRTQPFLFATLPLVDQHPLQLWVGNGLLALVGDIPVLWGGEGSPPFSRTMIRELQEWGLNLLQFVGQRRHLTQLLHLSDKEAPLP
ncbi:hypothetical protein BST81_01715 [Leptolyngbya sp. 'hensonii']|uniref:hypothetical protein n=1 Tax=Leptolyngbya sp. 'hensonii' TaxID=1922337 RepID=UPI00094FB74D|nr:hypothetical protein [Leptolyngbya sp. 'hensonii']OLP20174.1 hypothetical protein BST81_01715 [Leptolyngbya sp. 'hensonii']